jgi:hypothetical protein
MLLESKNTNTWREQLNHPGCSTAQLLLLLLLQSSVMTTDCAHDHVIIAMLHGNRNIAYIHSRCTLAKPPEGAAAALQISIL